MQAGNQMKTGGFKTKSAVTHAQKPVQHTFTMMLWQDCVLACFSWFKKMSRLHNLEPLQQMRNEN